MVDKNESTMKWKVDITQLKSSMQEAKRAISLANAEFKTATAGLDKWSKSATGVEANLERLNKILPQQRSILKDLESQYKITAEEMGTDSAEAQRLAIQVEKQRAVVAKTEADIKKYSEQLETMGKEEADATKETEKLAKEADKSADKLKAFGSAVADVAVKGLIAFTTAVVGAVAGLTSMTLSAGKYADEMVTMSKVTGVSTEKLQAYQYASELVDVSLETLTGSMNRNVRAMAQAQKGSSAYADAYKRLGVSVVDANGELRDSEEVYWEVIDALGKVENETERDALAMQLFGKSARDLNPLIIAGSDAIAQYTEEAKAMGAVMSSEQLEALNALDDSMRRLQAGASSAKNALGLLLLPQLQELATTGVDLLGKFTRGIIEANGDWEKISEVVGSTVKDISSAVMAELPKFMELGAVIVSSLSGAIIESLPLLITTAIDIAMQLISGLNESLPDIINAGMMILEALINGLTEAIPQLMEMLPTIIVTIVTVLIKNLPKILEMGVKILVSLVQGIGSALGTLWSMVSEVASGIISRISAVAKQMLSVGEDIVSGIWSGISSSFSWLKSKLTQWVGNVTDFIKRLFGIGSPSKVMADEVGKWLSEGIALGFTDDMPKAVGEMKNSLTSALDELKTNVALQAGNLIGDVTVNGGSGSGSNTQVVNFSQVINSPKAVDRLTLYRQTNSLLFSAKVGLANV